MEDNVDLGSNMGAESKKVLSQWEIDSLLGNGDILPGQEIRTPPAPAKIVRPYDFRRPDKFSKEHLRALQVIHESFARGAASSLSSYLRTGVQIRLSSIEQAVYGEYVEQLQTPTVVNIVTAEPLPGPLIIEINLGLAFAFMDRLLGGTGRIQQKAREVTDIELLLLRTIVKSLLLSLREAWSQLSAVTPNLDDLSFNPETVQAALPGDVGVLLLFEVRFGDTSSTVTMFVPYALLEPVIEKLSAQMWFSGIHKETLAGQEEIRRQLEKVEVPFVVNLGVTRVSIKEFLGLQEGNVIRLDTSADQELEVRVGGKQKYWARPGRVGRSLGVVITRVSQEHTQKEAQLREPLLVGDMR